MKLERLPEFVLITVVTLIAIAFAIWAGTMTGGGQTKSLSIIAAVIVAMGFGFIMRARIWILIPLSWAIAGQFPFLPLPFTGAHLGALLAFGWFLVFRAVKIVRNKPQYDLLDLILFANLIFVVITFVRNPVGVDALGSDRVGGRPYADILIAFLGYWVLVRADLTQKDARKLPILFFLGQSVEALCGTITNFIPSTAPIFSRFYTGISAETFNAENLVLNPSGERGSRLSFLGHTGLVGMNAACAYVRPLALINPVRFLPFVATLVSFSFVLLSGYRNCVLSSIIAVILGTYFRKKKADLLVMASVGVPLLIVLVMMQGVLFDLPLPAQRALSFLPGKWSYAAVRDAKSSTEWRVYMWKAMLFENKYISNRWLGDGFGYSKVQYNAMLEANARRISDTAGQENYLITGQVHSGPISAIRYVGILGLALYLLLICYMASRAIKLIKQASGTPYFPAALFFGITITFQPIFYVFVFGGYDSDMPTTIFQVGMLKLIESGLQKHLASNSESANPRIPERLGTERLFPGGRRLVLNSGNS